MPDLKVGKVTHYYDKIGVAIVELSGSINVGDKIKIVKGDESSEQEIESMQIEHEQVKTAKKGQTIGLKVKEKVKRNAEVYRVS